MQDLFRLLVIMSIVLFLNTMRVLYCVELVVDLVI